MEMFQESLKRNIIVAVGVSHFLVIADEGRWADRNYVLIDGYGVRKDAYVFLPLSWMRCLVSSSAMRYKKSLTDICNRDL